MFSCYPDGKVVKWLPFSSTVEINGKKEKFLMVRFSALAASGRFHPPRSKQTSKVHQILKTMLKTKDRYIQNGIQHRHVIVFCSTSKSVYCGHKNV